MKKTIRAWIHPSPATLPAAVSAPPTPSARPSARETCTCLRYALLASAAGFVPCPAACTHPAAGPAKRPAAATAISSGARSGSARSRRQRGSGSCSGTLMSVASAMKEI